MRAMTICLAPVSAGIVGGCWAYGVLREFSWELWVVLGLNLAVALTVTALELVEDR